MAESMTDSEVGLACTDGLESDLGMVLLDHAGHGFTYELAADLVSSGVSVTYGFTRSLVGPRATMSPGPGLRLRPVGGRSPFERYRMLRRALSETRLGVGYLRVVATAGRQPVVAANMPVLTLIILWLGCILLRRPRVLWLQDLQSELALRVGGAPPSVHRVLRMLERAAIRWSSTVITISGSMADECNRLAGRDTNCLVLRNWAPLEQMPTRPRRNGWSARHGLDDFRVVMYSGTLARKHSPTALVRLARSLDPEVERLVVVSEGEGAELLAEATGRESLPLVLLPFQPFEELPEVLATADVLVVLLSPEAAPFSVPSKILSYLCAGRAIVAAVPHDNLASQIVIDEAAAGVRVDPNDIDEFCDAIRALLGDETRRATLGSAGRSYAERHFAASHIRSTFLGMIGPARNKPPLYSRDAPR